MWQLILKKAGYEVTPFNDPRIALEAIRQNPPQVLVSDVGLPGMTGIELAITLIEESIPTRVILISGQPTTQEDIEKALARGYCLEVLPKPLGAERLLRVVLSAVEGTD